MALRPDPESLLTSDNGTLELAVDGDPDTAAVILDRVRERFGGTVRERFRRQFFDREYWFLDVWDREYTLMRCPPPSTPPGVCLMGPIDAPEALALFREVAASFGAAERDLRAPRSPRPLTAPARRPWWKRKRYAATSVVLLVLAYPASVGPFDYAANRGWLPTAVLTAGDPFYAPYRCLFSVLPPSWSQRLESYGGWWRVLAYRHKNAASR